VCYILCGNLKHHRAIAHHTITIQPYPYLAGHLLLILVIDLGLKVQKCFFDPFTHLGADLEILHFIFVGKPLRLIIVDLTIITQITFKSHEDPNSTRRGILLKIGNPELSSLEAISVCIIKTNEQAIRLLVVQTSDMSESFLARSIPDMQLE
jgi:hypothetical protein